MDIGLKGMVKHDDRPAQLNALAYAQGTDIHVAPGQQRHVPHEAWHVVQQAQGRVRPTMQTDTGVPVNTDGRLEREADEMGAKALTQTARMGHGAGTAAAAPDGENGVIQGKWFRMSTLLDENDEAEVAEIQSLKNGNNIFGAFWIVVRDYPDLAEPFKKIATTHEGDVVRQEAYIILLETFEEESKSFTAGEVMQALETNKIIGDALANDEDDGIDELTDQFAALQISVHFSSDADQEKEKHAVYFQQGPINWETSDVIVESNPKPLKEICVDALWEGHALSPSVVTQLQALRKTAKLALYNIAGKAKYKITGARTKGKMNSFRTALEAIAKILANLKGNAHVATLMPETDLSGSAKFGKNAAPVEGTHVVARRLSIRSATSGSPPNDGRLMKSIRKLAGPQSKSYVQMHLLNDLVFGPGELWNLTPGPKQSNVDMEAIIEHPLKNAVLGKGLVITFAATVNYSHDPNVATDTQIQQNPDKYRFQSISFTASQLEYNAVVADWEVAGKQDPDIAAINGKRVYWRYGNLTPLVPKPRIFDLATTAQDLRNVNMQPAAAQRIYNFIQANQIWRPSGANKQKQLAMAVKHWDHGKTLPNTSTWSATSVLWT
jgi:hypothetical protein